MKRILGEKDGVCPHCGGTMIYLDIKKIGVVSQCRECGNCVSGRVKDEVKIYSYEEKR